MSGMRLERRNDAVMKRRLLNLLTGLSLLLCVAGRNPFGPVLEETVAGVRVVKGFGAEGEAIYRDPKQPATDAPGAIPSALQAFAREAIAAAILETPADSGRVPLFTLGIPGSPTLALLFFVFTMYGLQPGPQLMTENSGLIWAIIASMYIGNVMLLVLNLPLVGMWVKLLQIPRPYLYAGILTFAALGAFAVNFAVVTIKPTMLAALSHTWIDGDKIPAALRTKLDEQVRSWTFEPGRIDGQATETESTLRLRLLAKTVGDAVALQVESALSEDGMSVLPLTLRISGTRPA